MKKRTPIGDQEGKIDIIEHINDDHQAELLAILADYAKIPNDATPHLTDIFEEGCEVSVDLQGQKETFFIPFQLKGDIEEKILYLAYVAMVKQGKPLGGQKKRYFEVRESQKITDNMLRLVLKTTQDLPEKTPGFAYLFAQKTLEKLPLNPHVSEAKPLGRVSIAFSRLFLWGMKMLSSRQRQRVLTSMNKGMRYYTLQSVHKSHVDNVGADIAWIDVFLHGDTAGSVWARGLQTGDIIVSTNEYDEQTEHLHQGQALLVADETAMPALASILHYWENPLPPIIIIIAAKQEEQAYLPDAVLPQGSRCYRFVGCQEQLSQALLTCLKEQDNIDTAWGAMESQVAKKIRSYLRNEYGLTGRNNRIKAYWIDK